jgi:hypothetical protein
MNLHLRQLSQSLLIAGTVAGMSLAATDSSYGQPGPPPAVARLSWVAGNVSVQPYGIDDWGQAQSNEPIDQGDRVTADPQGHGVLEAPGVRVYLGLASDVTLVSLNPNGETIGIANGSILVCVDALPPGQQVSVQTPNGAVTVSGRAEFRVDVYPDQQSSVISNGNFGNINLNGGGGFFTSLGYQQSIQLSGTNPVFAQPLGPSPTDDFRRWADGVENHRFNSVAARYVSIEMAGYDLLDDNGEWQPQTQYGPIWFPRVQAGWAPYHNGHWVNRPFYGWTWVADEPWGIAPFHYGRWVQWQGRWGWIPGPREVRPIWSPAQVVFAGGIQIGGVGVSVWFPLGPGEPYRPWYPATPEYINQINQTNIHESTVIHVQNVYNVTNITNVTYVNKTVGVTAMNQADFAAGKPAQVAAVKVAPQMIEHVQAAAPAAKPPAHPVIVHPIAKPANVAAARPVLINNKGQQAVAAPNAKPIPVPVKANPPAPKPIPGHTAVGTPTLGGKPVAPAKPDAQAGKPEAAKPGQMKPDMAKPESNPSDNKLQPAKPAAKTPSAQAKPEMQAKPAAPAKSETPEAKKTPEQMKKEAADKKKKDEEQKKEKPD